MTLWPGLTRKETWRRYCDEPRRVQPERRTIAELRALGEAAREEYDESRHDWHPNLAIIKTSQLKGAQRVLDLIVQSNRHESDRIRGVGAIDAFPGLGLGGRSRRESARRPATSHRQSPNSQG